MATIYRMASSLNCDEQVEIFTKQGKILQDIFKLHKEIHENGSENYLPVIKKLIGYMYKTFHEENMIMMHAQYPNFFEHAKEHLKFTQTVEEFLKSYQQGADDLGFKIFVFLKNWIRDHNLKLDVECMEYMRKNAIDLTEVTVENVTFESSFSAPSPAGM